ncbi:MAG: recombination protein RecR [Deltaproteobacteria bacterium]|nr:recombination protein RecR [Deltaproteobacteria bacterium]
MPTYGFPSAMRRLILELSKLPTIGEKTAMRLAYHLIKEDERDAADLAMAILEARKKIVFCRICFGLADEEVCPLCSDRSRDKSIICVVEKPADVIAIERTNGFHGGYHVLHGLWSPLKGVRPEETKINELINRVQKSRERGSKETRIEEIILATSTTVEGDATAMYLAKNVTELGVTVSRIAQGMPKGGELEYADQGTLSHAISGRLKI